MFRRAVICLSLLIAYSSASRADLVGYWNFDSDYADSSIAGNEFALLGGDAPFVPGRVGNGISLDGVSSRLENTSANLVGTYESFTLGAYVFVRSTPTISDAAILAGAGFELGLTFNSDNKVFAYAGSGSQNANYLPTSPVGVWHHVAQSYDGSTQETSLYFDGALVANRTGVDASVDLQALRIGRLGSATGFLDGIVDEAFLYDEVLSEAQVASFAKETIWWDNESTNNHWSSCANWSTTSGLGGSMNRCPSGIDHIVLNRNDVSAIQQIELDVTASANGFSFRNSSAVDIRSVGALGRLRIGGGGIRVEGAGLATIEAPIELTDDQLWQPIQGRSLRIGAVGTSEELRTEGHTLTIGGGGSTIIYSGLQGSGTVVKDGTGTLTLLGSSTHSGGIEIHAGKLIAGDTVLGSGGVTLSGASATLMPIADLTKRLVFASTGIVDVGSLNITHSGSRAGTGQLTKRGVGTLTLNGSTTHTGDIQIQEGTISGNRLGTGTLQFNGDNVALAPTANFSTPLLFTTDGIIDTGSAVQIVHLRARSGGGKLIKQGVGILNLQGSSTHTGGIEIQAGTVSTSLASRLGTGAITLDGGTLAITDNFSNPLVIASEGAIDTSTSTINHSGLRSGSGEFIKKGTGTLILSGTDNHVGLVRIDAGTLDVASAIGDVAVNNGGVLRGGGTVAGDASVNHGGKLTGTLVIEGNVTNAGRVAPGNSPGLLSIDGDLTMAAGGFLEIEVGGLTPGTEHDQVQVNGTARLGGTFEFPIINLGNGYAPSAIHPPLTFLTANSIVGNPSTIPVIAPGLDAFGLAAEVFATGSDLQLRFVAPSSAILFNSTTNNANWNEPSTWTGGVTQVPTSVNNIAVVNRLASAVEQIVIVSTVNAPTHELNVSDPTKPITVHVTNNRILAGDARVTIGSNGTIRLGPSGSFGTLTTADAVRVENGGMLAGNGQINGRVELATGEIRVGPSEALNLTNALNISSTSIVQSTLGPNGFGRIQVGETAQLGGTLRIELENGFEPARGSRYEVLAATMGVKDEFEMEDLPSLRASSAWRLTYDTDNLPHIVVLDVVNRADFNGDSVANITDVNSLVGAISTMSTNRMFDLNGDNSVNHQDLDQWLIAAGDANLGVGRQYRYGDANLDAFVDGSDFGIWNANKFTSVAEWGRGDFNADGVVDGSDFGIWNANKFTASDGSAVVPEPIAWACLSLALTHYFASRARRG